MRAHTIITTADRSRTSAGQRAAIALLAAFALAVPATANAQPIGSSHSGADSSGYSSVSAISGQPAESPGVTADSGSGYSSLSSITGAPASEPTFASGGSGNPADGFDWGSAAVGAGTVLAMVALGSAALLTVRRRTATQPSV